MRALYADSNESVNRQYDVAYKEVTWDNYERYDETCGDRIALSTPYKVNV